MNELIQKNYHKSFRYLQTKSPTILSGIGVAGVLATTASAIKATPTAIQILNQYEEEKGEELTKLDVVRATIPIYTPTILFCATTIMCILGANTLNKRNQASLTSAYAMLNESLKQYRDAARRVYGDDADDKIMAEIAKDMYIHADGFSVYSPELDESDKVLFYEYHSSRYFTSTMAAVINAQYHLNRNLTLKGWVSVNEYCEFLGLSEFEGGDDIGWSLDRFMEDGIMWLDFSNKHTELEDGLECNIISAVYTPDIEYWN